MCVSFTAVALNVIILTTVRKYNKMYHTTFTTVENYQKMLQNTFTTVEY